MLSGDLKERVAAKGRLGESASGSLIFESKQPGGLEAICTWDTEQAPKALSPCDSDRKELSLVDERLSSDWGSCKELADLRMCSWALTLRQEGRRWQKPVDFHYCYNRKLNRHVVITPRRSQDRKHEVRWRKKRTNCRAENCGSALGPGYSSSRISVLRVLVQFRAG